MAVAHYYIALAYAELHVEAGAGYGGCTRAVHHQPRILDPLPLQVDGVEQCRSGDYGRAVLVVVHHGYVYRLFEFFLYVEAFGRTDVLEVYSAEGGGNRLDGLHKFVDVGFVDFDVERVDAGEYLEQQRLSLHYGFGGHGADVAEAEYGCAVADDGHEVSFVGIAVGILRVLLDFQAGPRHAGRIGQRQVALVGIRLGGHDLYLARADILVVSQRFISVSASHLCFFSLERIMPLCGCPPR